MNPVLHDLSDSDRSTLAQLRAMAAPSKGVLERAAFDAVIEHTPAAEGVTHEAGAVGGVRGWWSRPAGAPAAAAILYLHGGEYVLGSASAYPAACASFKTSSNTRPSCSIFVRM